MDNVRLECLPEPSGDWISDAEAIETGADAAGSDFLSAPHCVQLERCG